MIPRQLGREEHDTKTAWQAGSGEMEYCTCRKKLGQKHRETGRDKEKLKKGTKQLRQNNSTGTAEKVYGTRNTEGGQ
jgi:hypothetical protein